MQVKKRKIQDLKPDDKNFNKGSEFGDSLIGKSFDKFGAGRSILIDKNDNIIAGNKSTQKFAEQGGQDVIVVETDGKQLVAVKRLDIDLNTPEGREMALADNATAKANIVWDAEVLQAEVSEAVCEEWGVEVEKEKIEVEEDDYDVPEEINTDIVLGDLFEIGEHRLLCGDSTDSDQVAKLMNGEKADMVFTDPPYGMNLDTDYSKLKGTEKSPNAKGYKWDKVIGDDKEFDFLTCYALFEYVKEQFWWGADYYFNQLPTGGGLFVWQKRDKADSEMIGNDFEICWSKQRHKKATFWKRWVGFDSIEKGDKRVHPTQKPIDLASWFIKDWSLENNIIIDLFLGSGTTMVAAHQLKRKCYGLELDPKYCQLIVDRMIKLDPSIEIKKNGQPYAKSQ